MKKVTFQISAPGAKQVYLAGDFTQWETEAKRMTRKREQSGSFFITVSLSPGTYEYKFIVDGQWREDPSTERRGNEFGTNNSVIHVG
jgi:1,4-alpha-glucan branching enzyme